ncbi:MAG: pyridoxal phosphate-dependent aminotransferase family protein, partial [Nitrospinota bacterium]|nr:pyridoxal phosphate-dependent aminotransferase family protein [Nitrospinota bacterium]
MTKKFFTRLEDDLNSRKDKYLYREPGLYKNYQHNLASNDYFQLRSHPNVIDGIKKACEKYGSGSGASPLLSGFLQCHQDLLDEILNWKKKPSGMLFNSGFVANQALLKHLPEEKDLILADRLIHHSLAQALLQGPAKFKRYGHLDMQELEKLLKKYSKDFDTIFVVTESVFSMDGDYPDLKNLVELKNKFPFLLILDEAHGTGVFGKNGGGLAEEMGVLPEVDILIGTFGKALASMGAYVLANNSSVIDYLTNVAGEYIYSTFLAPSQVGAAHEAIKLIKDFDKQREKIRKLSKYFRKSLNQNSFLFESPIIPILIKDPMETMVLRDRLLEKGFLVGA